MQDDFGFMPCEEGYVDTDKELRDEELEEMLRDLLISSACTTLFQRIDGR